MVTTRKNTKLKSNPGLTKLNKLMLFLMFLFMPSAVFATDHVVISQVLYDPVETESGGEAVELYNPTDSSVNISGFVLKTESSATDVTIPAGVMIKAGSYYLVADAGWSDSKDNTSWPDADHEEAISLTNSNAGVALLDLEATTIDAIGWGDSSGINEGLYEGTPADGVSAGQSLNRTGDTDNNSFDFSAAVPDFHNSAYNASSGETEEDENSTLITLQVNVSNAIPVVENISITPDDADAENIQILPLPGRNKNVTIQARVTDEDGLVDLKMVIAVVSRAGFTENITLTNKENVTNNTGVYEGTFELQFYLESGEYLVEINASDAGTSHVANRSFEVLEMTAISLDAEYVNFLDAILGDYTTVLGDLLFGTENPTARNTGNTALDLGMYGTNLQDGNNSIAVDNIRFSFDNEFSSALSGNLSTELQTKETSVAAGEEAYNPIGFRLYVPTLTRNGEYSGTVSVVGVSS